ncbi:MAG: glycosyltransferase family 2 protein [Thermoanaerobaculia bacterium]
MATKLSIVVPNLDCPLAGETVAALEAGVQPGRYEIIVVGRDAQGVVPALEGVRLVESETRLSPGAARNLGVEHSSGELILFTDADCTPHPDWALHLANALDDSEIVGGSVDFDLDGNRWAVADNIASFHGLLQDRAAERATRHALGSLNLGVRRTAWERLGGFDETMVTSEDHDWFFRALDAGIDCAFEPRACVTHAPIRASRKDLVDHAAWYGRHFNEFRRKHPGVFDRGFTWKSAARLRLFAPMKAWVSAISIFLNHRSLRPAVGVLPRVALFRKIWYRTVAEHWTSAL